MSLPQVLVPDDFAARVNATSGNLSRKLAGAGWTAAVLAILGAIAFMGSKTFPVVNFNLQTYGVCMSGPNCPNCPVRPWHYVHPSVWWGAWNQVFRPGQQREALEQRFDWLILNAIGDLERVRWDTNAAAASGLAAKSQTRIDQCLVCLCYLRTSECSWLNNVYVATNSLPNMTSLYGHLLKSNSFEEWLEKHKDQVALKREKASQRRFLRPPPPIKDDSVTTNQLDLGRRGSRPSAITTNPPVGGAR